MYPRRKLLLQLLISAALPLGACQTSPLDQGIGLPAEYLMIPGSTALIVGDTVTFYVVRGGTDTLNPATIGWSSSNSQVASVNSTGRVIVHSAGQANISAVVPAGLLTRSITATAPGAGRQPIQFGVHMDLTYYGDAAIRLRANQSARALGARVSRNSFMWDQIERVQGTRDWSRMDAVITELEQNSLEPLMVVLGSPAWASGASSATPDYQFVVPQDSVAFAAWTAKYVAFMTEAATRYRGRVHKWELWNEENDIYFWKPAPNLDRYVQWYRAVYAAIHQADPTAQLALGGLSGLCCTGPTGINGFAFLQGLYTRGVSPDIVAIHPYAAAQQAPEVTIQFENNFTDIAKIHDIMVNNGAGNRPMWITEWGWSTAFVSLAVQADYVDRSLHMLYDQYTYVTLATYFVDYDKDIYPFGLADAAMNPKPSGIAFRDFVNSH